MRTLAVIAHNIRSTYNIGSLLRTADGLGIEHVYITGYSPYPLLATDTRLPHVSAKIDSAIHKTALGAEKSVSWSYYESVDDLLTYLRGKKYVVVALEQHSSSVKLPEISQTLPQDTHVAILLGEEVDGIEPKLLAACDLTAEIPMYGEKESFNVAQAAAMALYELKFH